MRRMFQKDFSVTAQQVVALETNIPEFHVSFHKSLTTERMDYEEKRARMNEKKTLIDNKVKSMRNINQGIFLNPIQSIYHQIQCLIIFQFRVVNSIHFTSYPHPLQQTPTLRTTMKNPNSK